MDGNDPSNDQKRRRACDVCRRSKIKCDAPTAFNEPCKHCSRFRLECTFIEASKRRGPPKGYVSSLESRCRHLEQLLRRFAPAVNIDSEIGPSFTLESWNETIAAQQRPGYASSSSEQSASPSVQSNASWPELVEMKKDLMPSLERELQTLKIEELEVGVRFHGQTSGFNLVRAAINMKEGAMAPQERSKGIPPGVVRSKFWKVPLWKQQFFVKTTMPLIQWPDDALMRKLIATYFATTDLMLPIIHRGSFEENVNRSLHQTDAAFAKLLLLVCAAGSRYVDDPEVYVRDDEGELDVSSAGWKYFIQAYDVREPPLAPATLANLQCTALICIYLLYQGSGHAAWLVAGIGIRFAVDVGLHRESVYPARQPLQNQLWKRTFWALVSIDTISSARLGRPTSLALDDIDVAFPLEFDDETYDEAIKGWNPVPGKLPRLAAYTHWVKLEWILGQAVRLIHAVPEPALTSVQEIDAALEAWLGQLPTPLRWDTPHDDDETLQQSALLQLSFLSCRITAHRRFIMDVMRHDDVTQTCLDALKTCSAAAHASVEVMEYVKLARSSVLGVVGYTFNAASILLLHIWYLRRTDPGNPQIVILENDIQSCKGVLQAAEKAWYTAGKFLDMLNTLDQTPALEIRRLGLLKRDRSDDDDGDNTSSKRQIRDYRPYTQELPRPPDSKGLTHSSRSTVYGNVQTYGINGPAGNGAAHGEGDMHEFGFSDEALFQSLFGGANLFAGPDFDATSVPEGIDWDKELALLGLKPQAEMP